MKCIHCYREIEEGIKFCNYCGTMQPLDREAYEKEHPELAEAISDDEMNRLIEDNVEPPGIPDEEPQQQEQPSGNANGTDGVTPPSIAELAANGGNVPSGASLMQCPECGRMIAASSNSCPHCGCPFVAPWQPGSGDIAPLPPMGYPAPERSMPQRAERESGTSTGVKVLIGVAIGLMLLIAGLAAYYFLVYNKDTQLTVSTDSVTFTKQGGEKTVIIDTDADDFEITNCPSWVTAYKNGKEVRISCSPMYDTTEQEGYIIITAGNAKTQIYVKQSLAATRIELYPQSITASHKFNDYEITVETDGDVSAFNFDVPYFCSITDKTSDSFTVNVQSNSTYSSREGKITITSGDITKTINIGQKGACESCEGEGKFKCNNCEGTGKAYYDYEYGIEYEDCSECDGRGYNYCSACNGSGDSRY